MRALPAALVFSMLASPAAAQQVFTGLDTEYVYGGFGDTTLPENQDRITDSVWITRSIVLGIFNAAQESGFQGMGASSPSPVGTRWAIGSASDFSSLTFGTWGSVHAGSPPALIGQDLVLHLVEEDIYIDLRFTAWGMGGSGGSFAYLRSTIPQGCNPADIADPRGVLDLGDIGAFVNAFIAMQPAADLAEPFGVYDLADLTAFVSAFLAGCP